MKSLLFTGLALATLLTAASAQVALRPGDVKIEKVIPTFLKTPEFAITNGPTKRSTPAQWLEVEVEFQTVPEEIDELTFNYHIQVNGKMLVGDVTHIDIPKGRDHYSVAYVAPRSLENLMGGHPLTQAAMQGIWVDCTHQGLKLSESGKGPMPNVPQITGKVVNKSMTPFAPLFWDRYEALKPSSR